MLNSLSSTLLKRGDVVTVLQYLLIIVPQLYTNQMLNNLNLFCNN